MNAAIRTAGYHFLVCVALLACKQGNAAGPTYPIFLTTRATDLAGKALVYEIREALAASSALEVAPSAERSLIEVKLITTDPFQGISAPPGGMTIYTAAYIVNTKDGPILMSHTLGRCGQNKLKDCAQSILSEALAQCEEIRRAASPK